MGSVLSVLLWIAGVVAVVLGIVGIIVSAVKGAPWGIPWWAWLLIMLAGIIVLAFTPMYHRPS